MGADMVPVPGYGTPGTFNCNEAGGAGVAPLDGGPADVCELRKMYFLPRVRGGGLGARMIRTCLAEARALGYRACYLETLTGMDAAQRLYAREGFRPIRGPMGTTGHHGCDKWFIVELVAAHGQHPADGEGQSRLGESFLVEGNHLSGLGFRVLVLGRRVRI